MASLRIGRRGPLGLIALALATAGIVVFLFVGTGSAHRNKATTSHAVQTGGTATFALPPSAIANYIFPFMSLAFFSVVNISDLQQLMYRPLYWFGTGSAPTLNLSRSLASNPKYTKNNTQVSFTLKPYKWSNGETVTAQAGRVLDEHAEGREAQLGCVRLGRDARRREVGHRPEPDEGRDQADGPRQPVLVHVQRALADHAVPDGLEHRCHRSEGRQPGVWQVALCARSSSRPTRRTRRSRRSRRPRSRVRPCGRTCRGSPASTPKNPKAPNNSLKTYATNPLWQVVDGPWHLTQFDTSGYIGDEAEPALLGPGQAEARLVRRAAVHVGRRRVQRARRRQDQRRLPAAGGRHGPGEEPDSSPARTTRASRTSSSTRGTRGASPTSRTTSTRPVTAGRRGRSSASSTSARRSRCSSTSRSTARRSTRATSCRPTGRYRSSRRTPSRASSRPRTPTRTT